METLNHTIIAHELDMIDQEEYHDIRKQVDQVAPLLSGLRTAQLRQRP